LRPDDGHYPDQEDTDENRPSRIRNKNAGILRIVQVALRFDHGFVLCGPPISLFALSNQIEMT
jgi:hypothetical protein